MALILLCCFAFMAGFVDAMVGGGGLLQLPAMFILMPQLSLAQTLGTNKTASLLGTSVAAGRYIKQVKIDWRHLFPIIVTAFIGSFSGALLVSNFHKDSFMPFIIVALVLVLLYTLLRKNLGLLHQHKALSQLQYYVYALLIGTVIGVYDGLIGPGTGSFLVFAFIIFFGYDFLHASAHAKIINCVTNLSAVGLFLWKGYVVWSIALPVAIANMIGNYIGSVVAIRQGSKYIRLFFITIVSILIIKLGYDYFKTLNAAKRVAASSSVDSFLAKQKRNSLLSS
jgi:uncharacterized protein